MKIEQVLEANVEIDDDEDFKELHKYMGELDGSGDYSRIVVNVRYQGGMFQLSMDTEARTLH